MYLKLFREEAALLWDMSHVSLPTVKDYIDVAGCRPVIVMSYVPGENLAEVVERGGPIDDEHIAWILQRVLDALDYLHRYRHVVHCDIKPQNIILDTRNHNATLVDFGLAVVRPTSNSKAPGGTKYFLPPEFVDGRPPIPQSDIYSLGMTAVFLAGGNVKTGALPSDMHAELQAFIAAMVRRDPLARPDNAGELNHKLAQLRRSIFGRSSTREEFKFRKRGSP